jgi:hypothetical protein
MQCTLPRSALDPGGTGSSAINVTASLKRSISVEPQVGQLAGLSSSLLDAARLSDPTAPPPIFVPPATADTPKIDSSRRSIRTSILRLFLKAPPLTYSSVGSRLSQLRGLGTLRQRSCISELQAWNFFRFVQSSRKSSAGMSSTRLSTVLNFPYIAERIEGIRLDPI